MILRISIISVALLGSALIATPVAAQHAGHTMPALVPNPASTPAPAPTTGDPHAGHTMRTDPVPTADQMAGMDHSQMDHGSAEDSTSISPGPTMESPPPPEAGTGPPRAADAIWGAEAMRA
jgi:copper resistance protein B